MRKSDQRRKHVVRIRYEDELEGVSCRRMSPDASGLQVVNSSRKGSRTLAEAAEASAREAEGSASYAVPVSNNTAT
jgi:hypothetical protein